MRLYSTSPTAIVALAILFCLFAKNPGKDDSARAEQEEFVGCSVGVANDGSLALLGWTAPRRGGRLFLVVYDSTNTMAWKPLCLNANLPGYGQKADLSIGEDGTITAVWEQSPGDRTDVVLSQVTREGVVKARPKSILDSSGTNGFAPRIAQWKQKFVAVWQGIGSEGTHIYAQFFADNARADGPIRLVSHGSPGARYPAVACSSTGRIAFAWQEGIVGTFHVMSRSGFWAGPWGPIVPVDSAKGNAYESNPDVLVQSNNVVVVWKDYRTGESNIFQQRCSAATVPEGPNRIVNDDTAARWQRLPRIKGSGDGSYVIVWEDYRNNAMNQIGDIYGQRYSADGSPRDVNFKVNESPEPTIQEFPALGMNHRGEFAVAWIDGRSGSFDLYVRRYDANTRKLHSEQIAFPHTP